MNLDLFNPEQKEAITLSHRPEDVKNVLLIAGAGSGKTRVVVNRISYLINECKVAPRNILALTFTKKAAIEMKSRATMLIGSNKPVKMSTFHSLAADLLRAFGDVPVEIIDDNDKDKILRMLIKEKELGEVVKLKSFKSWLDFQRNKCIDPEESVHNENPTISMYRDLAKSYRIAKSQIGGGVFDFDDLLENTVAMLESNERLVKTIRNRWRYVMVDEYQDTNRLQFKLLSLLCGEKTQLLQVGDEDQLIYSWRGAEIEHILKSYEDSQNSSETKCIVLNRNYRCSGNILELANKVVSENVDRAGKVLIPHKDKGKPVIIRGYQDCSDESEDVASQLSRWEAKGIALGQMAVLFRTNRMARRLEAAMLSEGIPYKLHNGVAMFDAKESQLLMSLLRFTERPDETFFLRDIFSQIKYGLGPGAIDKEDSRRTKSGVDWITHLKANPSLMKKERVSELVRYFEGAKELLEKGDLLGAAQHWFHKWDITQFYKAESRDNRAETIIQLFEVIESYEHDAKLRDTKPTVLDFQEQRLLNDSLLDGEDEDAVHLMTIHRAKGLEFQCGAIVGMQDGVFPVDPDEMGDAGEENFRLAYVAITRFKEELMITRAAYRVGFNRVSTYSTLMDNHLDDLEEEQVIAYVGDSDF